MSDRHEDPEGLSPAEAEQIARIRRGDDDAFEALFRTHESLVYNICLGIVGTPDVARSLVQDLFCDLWDRRQDLDPSTSLKAYLAGAARNKALSWIQRSRPQESLDERKETGEEEHPEGQATPLDALQHQDLRQALQQAVDELPERRRRVRFKQLSSSATSGWSMSRPLYLRVERVGKQERKPHFPDNWTQTLESGKEASHA